MATGEVNYLLKADASGFTSEVGKAERSVSGLDKAQKDSKKSADSLGAAYKTVGIGIAAVAGASVLALKKMVKETSESDYAVAQLNATLKATGGSAGKSSEELQKTAKALQGVTAYSDEAVIGAQNLLLVFKNIKGDEFDRATKNALDYATTMKVDVASAAKIVGKALDDPEKGLAKLTKAGINFTDAQKDTIKALVEMGRTSEAQSLILSELEQRFEGSAEAARDTLGGALTALKISIDDLFELDAGATNQITDSINNINDTLSDPAIKASIDDLVAGMLRVIDVSIKALAAVSDFATGIGERLAKAVGGVATDDIEGLNDRIAEITTTLNNMAKGGQTAGFTVNNLKEELTGLREQVKVNQSLLGEQVTITDKYADSLLAVGTETKKFSLVVNNATVATTKNTTASKSGSEQNLKSEATLKKETDATKKAATEKEKLQARIEKMNASMEASHEAIDAMNRKTEEYIASIVFETEQMGKSARQQEIDKTLREAGTAITEKQAEAIRKAAGAHYDQTAAMESTVDAAGPWNDALQDMAANIDSSFTTAWSDALNGTADGFKSFSKNIKNAFLDLIGTLAHIAITRPIVMQFTGALGGLTSGAAVAGQGGLSGGQGGGLSGLLSGGLGGVGQGFYSGLGDIAGSAGFLEMSSALHAKGAATTGWTAAGDILGGFAGGYAGSKVFGETSGIGATLGGIAGSVAIPVPVLGAAIGSFLGSGVESLFGGKNDGNNNAAADFDLATGAISGRTWGKSPGDPASVVALVQPLLAIAESLGGSTLSGSVTAGTKGIQYGGKNFGNDTTAFYADAIRDVIEGAADLDEGLKTLLSSFEGTTEELVNFTTAVIGINEQAQLNTVISAIEDFTRASLTMVDAYAQNTDALKTQIAAFDGTAESANNLNAALAENKIAAYQFATAILAIGSALSEQAEAQAKSIRESVLTEEELFKKREQERNSLSESLSTLIDPAQIEKASQRILELNQQLFSSLTEEQQKAGFEAYAQFAENTNSVAQEVLRTALLDLDAKQQDINAQIANMLGSAASKQQKAADTMLSAANILQSAARSIGSSSVGSGEVAA